MLGLIVGAVYFLGFMFGCGMTFLATKEWLGEIGAASVVIGTAILYSTTELPE